MKVSEVPISDNDPLENPEKIHGGVGLSHYDNTTLIVYETGPVPVLIS
jgi:hypothetical protein